MAQERQEYVVGHVHAISGGYEKQGGQAVIQSSHCIEAVHVPILPGGSWMANVCVVID